jgi:hypothetical protein
MTDGLKWVAFVGFAAAVGVVSVVLIAITRNIEKKPPVTKRLLENDDRLENEDDNEDRDA